MSTVPPENQNLDQLDEELVAYLDGELEPQAAQKLEEMLANNESSRKRLNQLANSWDLLDQLPRATVDDLFTRTTVEMVALDAEDEIAKKAAGGPAKRWLRWLSAAVAVACAAVVGFVIVELTLPDPNELLLENLPVIQDLELYRSVNNLDFVKQLKAANLFVKESAETAAKVSTESAAHSAESTASFAAADLTSVDQRRAWMESLPAAEKVELRNNLDRFSGLPLKQQQSLRELEDALEHEPAADRAQYREMIDRYYDWWKTLSPIDQYNLKEESDPQKRVAMVEQLQSDQAQRALSQISGGRQPLKESDSVVIVRWMRKFATDHQSELMAIIPEGKRGGTQQKNGDRRPPALGVLAYEAWWSPTHFEIPPVSDDELHALRDQLSKEKQEQYDAAPKAYTAHVNVVRQWIQPVWREIRDLVDQGVFRWGAGGGPLRRRPPDAPRPDGVGPRPGDNGPPRVAPGPDSRPPSSETK